MNQAMFWLSEVLHWGLGLLFLTFPLEASISWLIAQSQMIVSIVTWFDTFSWNLKDFGKGLPELQLFTSWRKNFEALKLWSYFIESPPKLCLKSYFVWWAIEYLVYNKCDFTLVFLFKEFTNFINWKMSEEKNHWLISFHDIHDILKWLALYLKTRFLQSLFLSGSLSRSPQKNMVLVPKCHALQTFSGGVYSVL